MRTVTIAALVTTLGALGAPGAMRRTACQGRPPLTGRLLTIDGPNAKETIASAINVHGEIVGRFTDQQDRVHGFLVDRSGTFQTLDVPGATFTIARGINDAGDVVGRYESPDGLGHGYIRTNGNYVTIDFPGPKGTETFAWNINNGRAVVGRFTLPGSDGPHGFLLSREKWSRIDYPGSRTSASNGINSSGEIVGIWFDATRNEHSFRLRDGRFTSIDVPNSRRTLVDAVLDSGTVSGTYTDANGVHRGYVMDATGCVTTINYPDFPGLTVVRGINARGDLVGRYADANGKGHGYLIRGYRLEPCER